MAKKPAVPKILIGKDLTVELPDGTARVIDFARSHDHEQMIVLRLPNGDQVLRSRDWLVRSLQLDSPVTSRPFVVPADLTRWNELSGDEQGRIDQRMQDLTLILTGDPFGDIVNGTARSNQHIDPRYDPRDSTLEERYARMEDDLKARKCEGGVKVHRGTAADTLRGQLSLVRPTGDKTLLIHGNTGRSKAQPIPDKVAEFVSNYIVKNVGGSRLSKTAHQSVLRDALTQAGLWGEVSERRINAYFERSAQGRGFFAHSTTARSKDGRPKQDRTGRWTGYIPFSWIEIDSSPINAVVIDQYGKVTTVTDILIAVCAVTRVVAGVRLITSSNPYDSREVRGLLWDCVRGAVVRAGEPIRALDMPKWVDINPPTPRLPTRVGSANTDRGSQFNCFGTIKALKALGSHARLNDPGAGFQKPHVEALHRTFDLFIQQLPGYKGANTLDSGRGVELGPMLRAEDMLELIHWFIERVYHRHEHSQLYHPDFPSRKFSPNEYMDLVLKGPGGRLSMNQDLSTPLGLLETKSYALQSKGVFVDHRWYNCPQFDDLKDDGLGEKGKPGLQIQVWIDDRHPEFIYALPPNVHAPILVEEESAAAASPPLADLLDREIRRVVGTEALCGSDRGEVRSYVGEANQALIRVANELAIKPERNRSGKGGRSTGRRAGRAGRAAEAAAPATPATTDGREGASTPLPRAVDEPPTVSNGHTVDASTDDMAALFDAVLSKESDN